MRLKKWLTLFTVAALLLNGTFCSVGASAASLEDFSYELSEGSITITKYNGAAEDVVIEDSYMIDGVSYAVSCIGEYAFENAAIESVEIPKGISKIGEGAFYNCDNLISVIIPESVTEIDLYAFDDCNNLTDVTVLNPEVTIGEAAFGYYYSGRKYYIVENFVIHGIENSTAYEYADINGMTFEIYVKPILGDVNGDKVLNIIDLVRLKKILSGSIPISDSNADINGDGACSAEDLVCVRTLLVYGEENLKIHTVTFKDSDGNILDKQKVMHSFAAIAPQAPIKENHKFIGWSDSFINVMQDMVIVAQYKEDTEPAFTVENVNINTGVTEITVAVSIKNNPGILGMTLSLEYDENIMTLTDASNGEVLSGVLNFTKANVLKSGCKFVWDGQEISSANIKDGTVLLLSFNISQLASSGTYPISISYEYGDIIDGNLSPLSFIIENGSLIIS